LLWNKPLDGARVNDGAIVDSVGAATPLNYDGLDGHRTIVDPTLLNTHASVVLGLQMRAPINYRWLDYTPGRTAVLHAGANDILTGWMSGCLIVRGTYNGAMSVFHNGTVDNAGILNQTVRRTFAASLPYDATGFSPLRAWAPGEIADILSRLGAGDPKVVGLVTAAGAFYSVLLFYVETVHGRRSYCVGGCKPVPTMSRVRLMAQLMA